MPPTDELQICRAYAVRIHDATVQAGGATVLNPDVTAQIVEEARRDAVEGRCPVIEEVLEEYEHGRRKWGGPDPNAHDDAHTPSHWENMIRDKARQAVNDTPQNYRHRMLQVASLAIAAVCSFDRKHPLPDAPAKAKVQG